MQSQSHSNNTSIVLAGTRRATAQHQRPPIRADSAQWTTPLTSVLSTHSAEMEMSSRTCCAGPVPCHTQVHTHMHTHTHPRPHTTCTPKNTRTPVALPTKVPQRCVGRYHRRYSHTVAAQHQAPAWHSIAHGDKLNTHSHQLTQRTPHPRTTKHSRQSVWSQQCRWQRARDLIATEM